MVEFEKADTEIVSTPSGISYESPAFLQGYVTREQLRENGRIKDVIYTVYETPKTS